MSKKTKYTPEQADRLDRRYDMLRANLDYIANNFARTEALYPMMARVIYEDFETLVATTIEDHMPVAEP